MFSTIIVVDISADIKIMIIATFGATLDGGTAYPAPPFFVGPSDPPPWPFRSSSLRPELPASKQPGCAPWLWDAERR